MKVEFMMCSVSGSSSARIAALILAAVCGFTVPGCCAPDGENGHVPRLAAVKDAIEGLVRLKVTDDGRVVLDRDIWNAYKKTEKEVLDRIRAEKMRYSWGYQDASELERQAQQELKAHPHIYYDVKAEAFARFTAKCGGVGGYSSRTGVGEGLDQYIYNWRLESRFMVSPESDIRLGIIERSGLFQEMISLKEKKASGEFTLFIFLGTDGPVLRMEQSPDKTITVSLYNDGKFTSKTSKDFKEFMMVNKDYFIDKVRPLLEAVGIRGL